MKIEIVVNDFGVLEQLNSSNLSNNITIRVGRVLDKSFHDIRVNSYILSDIFSKSKVKWYDNILFFSNMTEQLLKRYHVTGVDIDIPSTLLMYFS